MDAILVSEMGVAWVPSVFEDANGVASANSTTVTAKDANGYNVRITSAPGRKICYLGDLDSRFSR